MTNKEILKKAIEKATKNGYDIFYDIGFTHFDLNKIECVNNRAIYYSGCRIDLKSVIFSRDFAKALCGTNHQYYEGELAEDLINNEQEWQYYLQQIVIEEDYLKYLEGFLK